MWPLVNLSTWHKTSPGEAMPSPKIIIVTLVIVVIGIAIVFRTPLRKIVAGA
jgi:hypothetical protein